MEGTTTLCISLHITASNLFLKALTLGASTFACDEYLGSITLCVNMFCLRLVSTLSFRSLYECPLVTDCVYNVKSLS